MLQQCQLDPYLERWGLQEAGAPYSAALPLLSYPPLTISDLYFQTPTRLVTWLV